MRKVHQAKNLGLIDPERLVHVPEKHWKAHEFCFHLHDQIAHMLVEYDSAGIQHQVVNAFRKAVQGHEDKFENVDILEFMKEHELTEQYQQHVVVHVAMALTSDMLHFLYEALLCFEKRKFTVGLALLRKPLKENVLYLAWVLADENDFIARFEKDVYQTLNHVGPEKRKQIYAGAIKKLALPTLFDAETLWAMIHSKQHANGFEPACQRATHLITSAGPLLRTEDYSFNLIFEDPADDSLYEFIYGTLPYVLMFVCSVALELFNCIMPVNERTYNHLLVTMIGTYESLFVGTREQLLTRTLMRQLKDILVCIHCDKPLRVTKSNAPDLYMSEQVICTSCGLPCPVPFYWLLARAKVTIRKDKAAEGSQGGASSA